MIEYCVTVIYPASLNDVLFVDSQSALWLISYLEDFRKEMKMTVITFIRFFYSV